MKYREFTQLRSGDRVCRKEDNRHGQVYSVIFRDGEYGLFREVCVAWDDGDLWHISDACDYDHLYKELFG